MSFYELQAPTAWADPPSTWSSTSLDDVEACPRRWQLLRSRWGDFERFPVRPHPAAIEGQIVHEALDRLTRACGQRGNPAFGSSEFLAALTDADFFPGFARAVAEWQQRLTTHPRPGPVFRLRVSAEELANRAVRLFREQYQTDGHITSPIAERAIESPADLKALLKRKRALSEVRLTHPRLPFKGVLDRVHDSSAGVEVVDFKTGRPSEKHRRQLLRYALLWWRETGDVPARISAQYLDGIVWWPVTQAAVEEIEFELEEQITLLSDSLCERPASPRPGSACATCAVRARCSPGWAVGEESARAEGRGDVQVVVRGEVGSYGFLATSRDGAQVAVVYDSSIRKLLAEYVPGIELRIMNGVWKDERRTIELRSWSEVFLMRGTSGGSPGGVELAGL